jgi:hypothetical protein
MPWEVVASDAIDPVTTSFARLDRARDRRTKSLL